MSVTILSTTTKNPRTVMGERAGVCYGADIFNTEKNYARGLDCLQSQHGRVLEFVNVEMIIEGYSSRVIREWYTHIAGGPTRLQASTRYIDYNNFEYFIPQSIQNNKQALNEYDNIMTCISLTYKQLLSLGISKEDAANVLPLGLNTKIVDKRNLRNLIDMSHQRLCTRAYPEFRILMKDIMAELCNYSEEWRTIVELTFVPKCKFLQRCPEKHSCGLVTN